LLQLLQLPIVPDQNCVNFYGTSSDFTENICLGGAENSICTDDSGGSVTIFDRGQQTLIGIVSRESNPCQGSDPIILVRITAYLDWISQMTPLRV
jgi:secreted trypsin-like serine protease